MYITIMTGTKIKKLSLHLSKEQFINAMVFDSPNEIENCKRYLELKGIEYHITLANFIGLNENGKVEYKRVSCTYQYDKRIRNILFKYISAFEEGVRALICNEYSRNLEAFKKVSSSIVDNINHGSSLSQELESIEFSKLLALSRKLPPAKKMKLYGDIDNLTENLDAIRELRNAVSHHRLLFIYEDFEPCVIDGKESDTLQANVNNLYQLMNLYYRPFFKTAINDAINDSEDELFMKSIPTKAILRI